MLGNNSKKEALLIMFGHSWSKRYWSLDGQDGRPSIAECIDLVLKKETLSANEDLVGYVEKHLNSISRRCERLAQKEKA